MAEHLHGYPRCDTPAGSSCTSSDLHWEECKTHGAFRACEASVRDGIPTGQYRCSHDEAPSKPAPAKKAAAKPKVKPRKAARAKPKPKAKKKAAPRKAKTSPKKKAAKKGGAKKGARKKK